MAKSTRSFLVHVITIIRPIGPVSDMPYDIDRRKNAIEASWMLLFLTHSIQGPDEKLYTRRDWIHWKALIFSIQTLAHKKFAPGLEVRGFGRRI